MMDSPLNTRPEERDTAPALAYFSDPDRLRIYDRFQSIFLAPGRLAYMELALAKFDRPPASVLEIGCGRGDLLLLLADRFPDARLTGIDTSRDMTEAAADRLGGRAEILHTDVEGLGADIPEIDLVLGYSTFRFWRAPARELKRLETRLRPGGLGYLTDLRRDIDPDLLKQLTQKVSDTSFQALFLAQVRSAYSAAEARAIFADAGIGAGGVKLGGFGGAEVLSRASFDLIQRHEPLSKAVFALRNQGFGISKAMDTMMHIYLYGKPADGPRNSR
ncbi:class I SAM-dependent methyltransferase [Eilatimonas milleporae]|uniref:Methyltransferase family protein n=1 Tax=Eilatimonas milleporae TaxID=911205 RepID=A0A3M0CQW6_9PROT|nr:class I SAM-dependent methyltransferase [Eilatimonas milleporae]RMB11961.1 methyltransferase family protein [Eilatimonas milleporae]